MTPPLEAGESPTYIGPVKLRLPSHPLGGSRGTIVVTPERIQVLLLDAQVMQRRRDIEQVDYEERTLEASMHIRLRGYDKTVEYFETKRRMRRLHRALAQG